ncbi:hypothetical protein [Stutzerimonas zhaodongensis]|uniref:hypothetical protein n=1 Tax=Stutzerimonas zhaodongensis TaxID=1176257 RepID=UPI001F4EE4A0|nr:hypothetical protein [Stutzerimonas zhaodongensis]UNG18473.1 hypothetical protein MKP10_22320 [Stutzerimonas zhaodongensis]
MDKAYRLLPWLTATQAANWIAQLTETILGHDDFLQLCEATQCPVYLNCEDWQGFAEQPSCDSRIVKVPVIGAGYCAITRPTQLYEDSPLLVRGPAILDTSGLPKECDWFLTDYNETRGPELKPIDVQALGAKMNAIADQLPFGDEAETLRKQLELESAGRYVAEGEVLDLRDELGAEREARLSAERRAKKAEAAAAKLRQEMEATYHAQKADEEYRAGEAYRNHLATGLTEPSADPVNGLQFPYSTMELEAMRKVASEHWANLTPDKRQPTQLSIQKALCDALGLKLDKNGDPPRKTKALATAIRPDSWPDTTG